ncbi:hypothetical protein PSPL106493_06385 [Pseudomonas plecoglossicida]
MHRCQHQVPRFRRPQRQAYRLEISQLADHDHIRVLTQRTAQALGKVPAVSADLALVDQAALTAVDNFHRVFEGDDVQTALTIELIDQGRQGAGLAAAGWPPDQDQPIGIPRNSSIHFFQCQLTQCRDAPGNEAKGRRRAIQLAKQIETKASQWRQLQGQILLITLFPALAPPLVEQRRHAIVQRSRLQARQVQPLQLAIQAQHRYFARSQVQVARPCLHSPGQQVGHVHETPQRPSSR